MGIWVNEKKRSEIHVLLFQIGSLSDKEICWNWMHKDARHFDLDFRVEYLRIQRSPIYDLKPKSAVLFFVHSSQLILMIQIKKKNALQKPATTTATKNENLILFVWIINTSIDPISYIFCTFTMQINDVNNWMTIYYTYTYSCALCLHTRLCICVHELKLRIFPIKHKKERRKINNLL